MSGWFKLDDNDNPVACSLEEYVAATLDGVRHVDLTTMHTPIGECMISTVFLGLDHNYGGRGEPIVFETMVFNGPKDGFQARYRTWAEAQAGHKRTVAELMARYVVACVEGSDGRGER